MKCTRIVRHFCRRNYTTTRNPINICVIGSGPAGFYTAKYLLKGNENVRVSMIEKLPVPFGLVRYGVAPDHPEVKLVTNEFDSIASSERFDFFGNVNVGVDVPFSELQKHFHGIVLAYGADSDKKLGVEGEALPGVLSAREFVNWYNGFPSTNIEETTALMKKLVTRSDTAVIIGQGNVALDIARILTRPVSELRPYDIPDYALDVLEANTIRRVLVVGRRGPIQAACTTKELREISRSTNTVLYIDPKQLELDPLSEEEAVNQRAKKRMFDLMKQVSQQTPPDYRDPTEQRKLVQLLFSRGPTAFHAGEDGFVDRVRFELTTLEARNGKLHAKGSGNFEDVDCGVVFKSVGYRSSPILHAPFSAEQFIVPNTVGRVSDATGLYACGWVKRGPTGIIASNVMCAQETATSVLEDVSAEKLTHDKRLDIGGSEWLKRYLSDRGVGFVDYGQYRALDEYEREVGKQKGKLREKLVSTAEMLRIAHGNNQLKNNQ